VVLASLDKAAPLRAESATANPRVDETAIIIERGAEKQRRARIAVRVGDHAVTVGELEDRLARIPPLQVATLGASSSTIVYTYTNRVLVRDLLLASGAEQRGLDKKPPASWELSRARANATLFALRTKLRSSAQITEQDVRAYYMENIARFDLLATKRTLEQVAPQIRTMLERERAEADSKQLIVDLRAKYVRDVDMSTLGTIVLDAAVSDPIPPNPTQVPSAH